MVGLYAAVPALLLYAALGSSRHLVVGPMSATAALSATIAAAYAAGVVGLVAGACRLDFISAFISEPVLNGFIVGLALTIIIGQVPALLGLDKPEAGFFTTANRGGRSAGPRGAWRRGGRGDLVGPAAAVVLIGFVEGLAAAKTYASRLGYDIDANQELVAL